MAARGLAGLAVLVAAAAGCGDGDDGARRAGTPNAGAEATATPAPRNGAAAAPRAGAATRAGAAPRDAGPLRAPGCRADVPRCHSVSGRIVYVERVDPDGDGDLHVVVVDRDGVTLAGLTAVDVSKDLRPRRDPRVGERAAAMGPVQTGSFGQSQVHALAFRTRR